MEVDLHKLLSSALLEAISFMLQLLYAREVARDTRVIGRWVVPRVPAGK
jgi:hypothetical protein